MDANDWPGFSELRNEHRLPDGNHRLYGKCNRAYRLYGFIGCDSFCNSGSEPDGIPADVNGMCRQSADHLRLRSQYLYLEHRSYQQLHHRDAGSNNIVYCDRY